MEHLSPLNKLHLYQIANATKLTMIQAHVIHKIDAAISFNYFVNISLNMLWRKCLMSKIFVFVCFLTSLCKADFTPDFQAPFCIIRQNKVEKEAEKFRLAIETYKATKRKYTDPKGVWDQQYLKKNPEIAYALKEFSEKKRGQSLSRIQTEGKTAKDLHTILSNEGFSWKDVSLQAGKGHQKKYWKIDGNKTENKQDPNVVKMRIYTHRDGAIVRIKACGIPDKKGKSPRRSPHIIMAVLKSIDSQLCDKESCNYDTSYANEAFKVTQEGDPGPKGPSIKYGLRLPFKNDTHHAKTLNQVVENTYMDLVHTNLKTDCPEPLE